MRTKFCILVTGYCNSIPFYNFNIYRVHIRYFFHWLYGGELNVFNKKLMESLIYRETVCESLNWSGSFQLESLGAAPGLPHPHQTCSNMAMLLRRADLLPLFFVFSILANMGWFAPIPAGSRQIGRNRPKYMLKK